MQTRTSLRALRIIWAVLLLGQFAFAMITMVFLWPSHHFAPNPLAAHELVIAGTIMMVVLFPAAFVIRRLVYQPGPTGEITPIKYIAGNIIFYGLCESVAWVGMFAMLMHGEPGGEIIVPAIAIALQIVNYPTGVGLSPSLPIDEPHFGR